ncbi:MAG: ferritin family protein [Proteobacteria bacterium]|nr:ferritin family protein [Pseudomonadota bacterium]
MMQFAFHIDEVFEMAIQMEENGAEFYAKAALAAVDPEVKAVLEKLSVMEVEHKALFSKLREEVVSANEHKTFYDPSGKNARYLKSIIDTQVFFEKEIDTSSMEEVLKEAIWGEKDSTVFYLGIRQSMDDEATKQKIDKIIEEEMSHIRILSERLKALKS